MARRILLGFALVWFIAGIGGLLVGLGGIGWLESALPPLAIDTDALRAAVIALGGGAIGLAAIHAGTAMGGAGWSSTIALLLAGVMTAILITLGAAAATSAVADPGNGAVLWPAAVAGLAGAAAYGVALVALIGARRARDRI